MVEDTLSFTAYPLGGVLYHAMSFQACWTPLHIAASAGREEIVRSLISRGAQLNSVNQNGCTPLHYAASKDRYEVDFTFVSSLSSSEGSVIT